MTELIVPIAVAAIPFLGAALLKILNDRFAVEENRENLRTAAEAVRLVVDAVEQVASVYGLAPRQKLNRALVNARVLLASHGLDLSDSEIELLIEAAVRERNEFRETLLGRRE